MKRRHPPGDKMGVGFLKYTLRDSLQGFEGHLTSSWESLTQVPLKPNQEVDLDL